MYLENLFHENAINPLLFKIYMIYSTMTTSLKVQYVTVHCIAAILLKIQAITH